MTEEQTTKDPVDTYSEDLLAFATGAAGVIRRQVLTAFFNVTEFSESDDEAVKRNITNVYKPYIRLMLHQYGNDSLFLVKAIVCYAAAFDGPSSIDSYERVKMARGWFYEFEEAFAPAVKGMTIDAETTEELKKTLDVIGYTVANVMRTKMHNHFNDAGWPLTEQYEDDARWIGGQLYQLSECPNDLLFEAAVYAIGSAFSFNPRFDHVEERKEAFKWVLQEIIDMKQLHAAAVALAQADQGVRE